MIIMGYINVQESNVRHPVDQYWELLSHSIIASTWACSSLGRVTANNTHNILNYNLPTTGFNLKQVVI